MTAAMDARTVATELQDKADRLRWNEQNLTSAIDRYVNHQDRDGGPDPDELAFIRYTAKLIASRAQDVDRLAEDLAELQGGAA